MQESNNEKSSESYKYIVILGLAGFSLPLPLCEILFSNIFDPEGRLIFIIIFIIVFFSSVSSFILRESLLSVECFVGGAIIQAFIFCIYYHDDPLVGITIFIGQIINLVGIVGIFIGTLLSKFVRHNKTIERDAQ